MWLLDKADKKAQRERELKMEREQIEREEEIKELSLKMRRKYVYFSTTKYNDYEF